MPTLAQALCEGVCLVERVYTFGLEPPKLPGPLPPAAVPWWPPYPALPTADPPICFP